LGATLTGSHRNDVTQLLPLIDGIGAIAGKRGRPRRLPDRVVADRGYDRDKYRRELWRHGVQPRIARRGTKHGSGLGRARWVVERTFAWLHNFRRLRIRWERDARLHCALLSLGCSLICWRVTHDRGPCSDAWSSNNGRLLVPLSPKQEPTAAPIAVRGTPGTRPERAFAACER
jgi:transposase